MTHRPPSTSPEASATPLEALWQAPMIIRVLLAGECFAVILTLAPEHSDNRWIYFGLISLMIQWVLLSTLGGLYLARRKLSDLSPNLIAYIALIALVLASSLVCAACWLVLRDLWSLDNSHWYGVLFRFVGITLIFGLLGLAAFQNHWHAQQLAVHAKQAELDALQARIQPHFLFNTLNTGVALVHQQPEKVEQLLLDLADLFRAALTGSKQISLQEELELTRRYVEIEQLRFGSRLRLSWLLPSLPPDLWVPALSIQPLVENAIHHGVEPSARPCTLRVAVEYDARRILVIVENDLPDPPASTHRGHKVGLQAARTRVQAMGGNIVTETEDGQFRATLSLPRT